MNLKCHIKLNHGFVVKEEGNLFSLWSYDMPRFPLFPQKYYPFCKTNWPQPNETNKLEFLGIPVHLVVNGNSLAARIENSLKTSWSCLFRLSSGLYCICWHSAFGGLWCAIQCILQTFHILQFTHTSSIPNICHRHHRQCQCQYRSFCIVQYTHFTMGCNRFSTMYLFLATKQTRTWLIIFALFFGKGILINASWAVALILAC